MTNDRAPECLFLEATRFLVESAAEALCPAPQGREVYFSPADWDAVCAAAFRWLRAIESETTFVPQPDLRVVCGELLLTQSPRLAMLTADVLTTRSIAPPLALSLTEGVLGAPYGVILFAAFPHAMEEITPLFLDGAEQRLRHSDSLRVAAVHESWLSDEGYPRRMIRFDLKSGLLVEQDVRVEGRPEKVLLLFGPRSGESAWHGEWQRRLDANAVAVANPFAFAQVADDKWHTCEVWQATGVPTAETRLLARPGCLQDATCSADSGDPEKQWVLKPRHGTEGAGVVVAQGQTNTGDCAKAIWEHGDDALVQPYTNDLVWTDADGVPRTCVIRINVTGDASGSFRAESGCVHAGPAGAGIASAGQGGQLRPISRSAIGIRTESGTCPLPADFPKKCGDLACAAVRAIAESAGGTQLCGVDVVAVVRGDGSVGALALEVNPRPAGLSHSRFIVDGWETEGEPGVSRRLWGR